jgi:hypothetical protein
MRHRSELGAVFAMQEDKQSWRVFTIEPRAWAAKTKDIRSRARCPPPVAHEASGGGLHRPGSQMPTHSGWNGPSVLRRLANRCASTNRVTLAAVRGVAHHYTFGSQVVALWHGFGSNSRRSEGCTASNNRASFCSGRMVTCSTMTPNPSIERTRSGLRPPRAAHVKR